MAMAAGQGLNECLSDLSRMGGGKVGLGFSACRCLSCAAHADRKPGLAQRVNQRVSAIVVRRKKA